MKVSQRDIERLTEAVADIDTPERRAHYRDSGQYGPYGWWTLVKDVDKRYRWDVYWIAYDRGFRFETEGLLDEHVDTALRWAITPVSW